MFQMWHKMTHCPRLQDQRNYQNPRHRQTSQTTND